MRRRADERRRSRRRRIALRVRFDDGGGGTSRDICAVGIFVETDRLLASGEHVGFAVELGDWDADGGFRIHGEGRVVRVETAGVGLDVVWSDIQPLGLVAGVETPRGPG